MIEPLKPKRANLLPASHEVVRYRAHQILAQRPQEAPAVYGEAEAGDRLLGGLL